MRRANNVALMCLQLALLAISWLKKEANKAVLTYDITLTITPCSDNGGPVDTDGGRE